MVVTTMEKRTPNRVEMTDTNGLKDELEKRNGEPSEQNDNSIDMSSPTHRKGLNLYLLTIALMLVVFMMVLDTTIISTAVPSITSQFHSIDDIGWYSSAYLLPLMSLQPTFGKIYSFFKVKPILLSAIVVFEIGSVICASAHSSYVFILGRLVAGIGAAAIYAGGMIIITSAVPIHRISIYLAALSSMNAIAAMAGPPLGGVFTDNAKLTWRFCFWINLPFGFIALVAFCVAFREPKREPSSLRLRAKLAKMDLGGTVLFVTGIVLLFVALQLGGSEFAWTNGRVLICLILSGLCLLAFVFVQRYLGDNATVPPRILLNRSVSSSILVSALMSLAVNIHTFYLPFYFQSAKGTSAASSGLRLLPYSITITVAELAVGAASSLLGVYLPFMYGGTSVFTVMSTLLCTLRTASSTARLVGYQVVAGFGFGSSMQLCATSIRAAVETKDIPIAATLSVFAPFFGFSIGAAIGQNIFRSALLQSLLKFMPSTEANGVIEAGGAAVNKIANSVMRQSVKEAYNDACRCVFILAAVAGGVAFLGTLCIKWRTLKTEAKKPQNGEEEIERDRSREAEKA
ncbi:MFS general substrate transporter [Melanomma pulvis-pyrius CBS 109.77]|uniref:MFS general substrate transporter n=1 Tax=Melanomma pulvis-pyrius CBS 109.77 TaxID=1314802 RepID=A0A6A6XM74_9PLEO|nr:MFS general substrate transporter [Melanomma pulvis-pyrius CBS 109.77]